MREIISRRKSLKAVSPLRSATALQGTAALSLAFLLFAASVGCSRTQSTTIAAPPIIEISAELVTAGHVAHPKIDEASGLAASRRTEGVLWVHNDSGGDAALYAITTDGKFLGTVALAGADNIDWEDIASFELGGRAYLLVADLGDNDGKRKNCSFYVIEEPDAALLSPAQELVVPVAWNVPVVYPDRPHDCEAVAVDPGSAPDGSEGKVFLLLKRENPNRLFTVPLRPQSAPPPVAVSIGLPNKKPNNKPAQPQQPRPPPPPRNTGEMYPAQTAWLIGSVGTLPQPSSAQKILPVPTGRYRGMPTAMDFSPDGRFALILTYGDVLLYPRRDGESWFAAFARAPIVLPPHKLGQAEAACFSRDSAHIFVTEENKDAPLLRYDLKPE